MNIAINKRLRNIIVSTPDDTASRLVVNSSNSVQVISEKMWLLDVTLIMSLAITIRAFFNENFVGIFVVYCKNKTSTFTCRANFHISDNIYIIIIYYIKSSEDRL
jgi:hypothetical protein